jgi:hypothetical protein
MKDTAVWNIEQGLALTSAQVVEATRQHSRVFETMRAANMMSSAGADQQVLPFPVDQPYVTEISGSSTTISTDEACYRITMTAHPRSRRRSV